MSARSTPKPAADLPPSPPVDLSVDLAGLTLANPMMTASGTCGYAWEYADFLDLTRLGAFVTKSITREPRQGNEAYRIVETRGGMLNAIGLANVGLNVFLAEKLPQLERMRTGGGRGEPGKTSPRIIVNVAGHSVDDYTIAAGRISQEKTVDAIELNVSCPNVGDGLTFGTNPPLLRELVKQVRAAMRSDCRLIVKLSPNVTDITTTAAAAIEGGASILSMVNTFTGMAIDIHKRTPRLANVTGGLSGPAIRPLAVQMVSKVYRTVARDAGVPIIGMGGIQTWQDAAEFLLAGASGLAVGTALFVDPATPLKILDGLATWLAGQGCGVLRQVVGGLQLSGDADGKQVNHSTQ